MPSANGDILKEAVLYPRVSTAEEQARNGYSLARQMQALRKHTPARSQVP